jgi:hypothetical protein
MTIYDLTAWGLDSREEGGVRMWIRMQRKPLTEILTTYLPSILLLLITFATTLFKPYFFEAALTVNLTNMLVMTTIFIGVMQNLPTTAYTKMIDIWLIGCQLVPFMEVVLLTAMELLREGDGSGVTRVEKTLPEDKESESTAEETRTINHHGAPRVVQLGLYREEGEVPQQAASAALATVERGPASPPSLPAILSAGEEEETRKQHKKYIRWIKYFGKSFTFILVWSFSFSAAISWLLCKTLF